MFLLFCDYSWPIIWHYLTIGSEQSHLNQMMAFV